MFSPGDGYGDGWGGIRNVSTVQESCWPRTIVGASRSQSRVYVGPTRSLIQV